MFKSDLLNPGSLVLQDPVPIEFGISVGLVTPGEGDLVSLLSF